MPHSNKKLSNRKSGAEVTRVPSLYSVSANMSPSKRISRKSSAYRDDDYQNNNPENIMMGSMDKWNSTSDINNRRLYSPDRSVSDVDRDRPVAYVQPIIHKSPSAVESSNRRNGDLRVPPPLSDKHNEMRIASTSDFTPYVGANPRHAGSNSADRSEVLLEEFDNSLFILCVVLIFINPVMGPLSTYCAWRAKKAFFSANWKYFRRWTVAAHALSSIGFGLSAIGFGMVGIKLYHMYSGIQCYYKCSFLTNNEFNWQGFWDELNKNRAAAANGASGGSP